MFKDPEFQAQRYMSPHRVARISVQKYMTVGHDYLCGKEEWIVKQKLRQAYIRGMVDLSMFLFVIVNISYFGVYVVEKYFMWGGKLNE